MPLTLEESLSLQKQFAGHIRQPAIIPRPQCIEDKRMDVYKRLFFANIQSFLDATFPHLKRIMKGNWVGLQRQFYATWYAQSPYFHRISQEFYFWLNEGKKLISSHLELALYEQSLFDAEVYVPEFRCENTSDNDGIELNWDQSLILKQGVSLSVFKHNIIALLQDKNELQDSNTLLDTPIFMVFFKNKKGQGESLKVSPMTMVLLELFQMPQNLNNVLNTLSELSNVPREQLSSFAFDFVQSQMNILIVKAE